MPATLERRAESMVEKGLVSLSLFDGIPVNDYVLSPGKITTIVGSKGIGKSTLASAMACREMLPPIATRKVKKARIEANCLRAQGYRKVRVPASVKHLVYSNFPLHTCNDQGYLARPAHVLDFKRMVLPNGKNNAQFFPFGSGIFIDEGMNEKSARDYTSNGMPKEQRQFLCVIRHRDIYIVLTSLSPTGVDKGLRDMSQSYLLIVHRVDKECKGRPRTIWYCLEFDNDRSCARFRDNPKNSNEPYVPYVFIHDGDIHRCVDSQGENKKFLVGMKNRAFEFKTWRKVV